MTETLLILLALALSAFFSGGETVLVSLNRLKFEALQRLRVKGAKRVVAFRNAPDRFLATCVVGNTIATVAWSSLLALKLDPYLRETVIAVVSTAGILLLGEVLPKSLGRASADRIAIPVAGLVTFFEYVLSPVVLLLRGVSRVAIKLVGLSPREAEALITRKDLEQLFAPEGREGVLDRRERVLISRLFRLGHQRVRDLMIPRTEIEAVRLSDSVHAVRRKFEESGYSRLLVIGKDLDDVKGFIHVLELFHNPEQWRSAIRPVLAVPENALAARVLRRMQRERVNLAVVVDEYGGTEGLLTIEDLVEQLFGEIRDEFDEEERLVRKLEENSFLVSGRAEIGYLSEAFGMELPRGDYATVSGLLNELAGRIPRVGEVFRAGPWSFRVLSTSRKRVEWVRIDRVSSQDD
ncbi:MAG: hemolysin family protein [candidate division KSB1 bacterium]|nr:hemolysin family protein [candidate division KSB1 bacterium]